MSGGEDLATPTRLLWAATISEAYASLQDPANHVRVVALRSTVQVGPIIVRSQSVTKAVDLLSADPVSMYIKEASVGDSLDHAAKALGLDPLEHDESAVPDMTWRLVPVAGKTWSDVQEPGDLTLLQDED